MWRKTSQTKAFDLDGETFKQEFLKHQDAILVDVRNAIEYYEGSIPNAINIDYMAKDFDRKITSLDQSKTYFVFCRNGNRSAAACKAMERNRLNVFKLRGGISAWPE
jgi:rhodanese-related sulfurtransferase